MNDNDKTLSTNTTYSEKLIPLEIENPPLKENTTQEYIQVKSDENDKIIYPSNCISDIFFYWAYKLLKKGNKYQLRLDNLGNISNILKSDKFLDEITPLWENKYSYIIDKASLLRCAIRANISKFICILILSIFETCAQMLDTLLIRQILLNFQEKKEKEPIFDLKYIIILLLLIKIVEIFLKRKCQFISSQMENKITVQIQGLIYHKLLKVSLYRADDFNEGKLLNFCQIDSEKFGVFISDHCHIILAPIQIVVYLIMLYNFFGFSFIFGFIAFLIVFSLSYIIQKKRRKWQRLCNQARDDRVQAETQIFNIIKIIKLYSWENAFMKKIQKQRDEELRLWKKKNIYHVFSNFFFFASTILMSMVAIICYNIFNDHMYAANIVTSVYIFNSLSHQIEEIPSFIDSLSEVLIASKRIEKFLITKEKNINSNINKDTKDDNIVINIQKCDFSTDKSEMGKNTLLKDINLSINKGELIGIIGEVGSGKSLLLNAILNNLDIIPVDKNSSFKVTGKISYVSQGSWLMNETVKNNILFFNEMDKEKYNKIINICELNKDINIFPGGDMTEIGEKGINLSGGQKTRISIARSIYTESDIYLFDDPLSSLDANVGMSIFNQVIREYLKDKTRIIVTHALQYIPYMDKVVYMKDGKIYWYGKSDDILKQDFYKDFVSHIKKANADNIITNKGNEELTEKKEVVRITKDEKQKKGKINFHVWYTFFVYAGGWTHLLIIIIINFFYKSCEVLVDSFLTKWSNDENMQKDAKSRRKNLLIYSLISTMTAVFILLRAYYLVYKGALTYNITMHDELIKRLMRAPVNLFHDTIPRGQIINRIGKDLEESTRLNYMSNGTIRIIFQLFGCIVICAIGNIYSLIILPFIFIIEYRFQQFYLNGGRDLSRIVGNARSPMISVFSETLYGISLIRAFNYENQFISKYYQKLNDFYKIKLFLNGTSNFFGLFFDLFSFILLIFILTFAIIFKNKLSPTAMGLLIIYSTKLMNFFYFLMNRGTRLEKLLTSVERCVEFSKIVQEQPDECIIDKTLENNFPKEGNIKFENYSVKYRPELDLVLKDINIDIKAGEKIGVVGRTGSGKSTLCLCLFRLLESYSGKIYIDNIDISQLGLSFLRQHLTVIPQEPILIEGTLKENVDPQEKHSDEEIAESLKLVGLQDIVKEKSLLYQICENGNNLSVGEKQLVCIARAILRKSKIIMMDEATASIDYNTENAIQNRFDTVFKDSTIITIAHRIKTVINYDKILVLDNGNVIEFDTPNNLKNKENGLFKKLCEESGL